MAACKIVLLTIAPRKGFFLKIILFLFILLRFMSLAQVHKNEVHNIDWNHHNSDNSLVLGG